MLATPLYQAPPQFSPKLDSEDVQYRPTKDLEAFNKLLPPAIEFVEGSSSGALAVPEGKYEPINAPPAVNGVKPVKPERQDAPKASTSAPVACTPSSSRKKRASVSLWPHPIDMSWPGSCSLGKGLHNSGNSCFLNSALQILLHTAPLLQVTLSHSKNECRVKEDFCMSCAFRTVVAKSHGGKNAFMPSEIGTNLKHIAKHMRKGRQEDSHEFLRYAIDAFQKTCLAGLPTKPDHETAETTWVHKIFGGRLRSRVTCGSCQHNSDTFDSILDLSLDIHNTSSLKDALRKFGAIDHLKGADKYKCEKCKKPVNAQKQFTIDEAPRVLTVHLKRFSPLGRKIGNHVAYDERVSLQQVMSEGKYGPSYSLYGVICHAGGGPNSGHYYAFVKSKEGRWFEMNDESVSMARGTPLNIKNAYMLFYLQNKGEGLEAAVNSTSNGHLVTKSGLAASMKKKRTDENDDVTMADEDTGVKVDKPFIGPLLPSPTTDVSSSPVKTPSKTIPPPSGPDPQASKVKQRIQLASKSNGLNSLAAYGSDDSDSGANPTNGNESRSVPPSSPLSERLSSPAQPPTPVSSKTIPATSFYGSSTNGKKRKSPDTASDSTPSDVKKYATTKIPLESPSKRSPWKLPRGLDPYSGMVKNKYKSRHRAS
ncbi:Ubiquitin carboxyl-terminal hydrolase [Pleurotus pulmonarius]